MHPLESRPLRLSMFSALRLDVVDVQFPALLRLILCNFPKSLLPDRQLVREGNKLPGISTYIFCF